MAKNEIINETVTMNQLQNDLKKVLDGMYKLNMPDAEITTVFRNMLESMANGKSKLQKYKDAMFRMLFREKKELLSLYNALNNSNYTDPEMLQITTLDRYWFISVKNDVAFAIMSELYIVEQQSTICKNMPLRNLFYVSETYRTMIKFSEVYRQKLVKILEPHFITFYNGSRDMKEDEQILRLSDAFERIYPDREDAEYEPELELIVHVYNINKGHNEELLERCDMLKEYMEFINVVRANMDSGMSLDSAVANAIDYSIKHGILSEFLMNNRDEVMAVVCAEYTFEDFKTETDMLIEEQTEQIMEQEKQINEQREQLSKQRKQLSEQHKQLSKKDQQLSAQEKEIERLRKILDERQVNE